MQTRLVAYGATNFKEPIAGPLPYKTAYARVMYVRVCYGQSVQIGRCARRSSNPGGKTQSAFYKSVTFMYLRRSDILCPIFVLAASDGEEAM